MTHFENRYNYKLTIAYDGTSFGGWQIQPNALSIQQIIQDLIRKITRSKAILIGSGRTDAGVHACGQVAHFICPNELDLYRFLYSLNSLLPSEIKVKSIEQVPLTFHAQKDAVTKIYHYHLHLNKTPDPFKRLYSYHIREKIDLTLLKEASQLFIGTHDFSSFANEAHKGAAARNAVRTLNRLDIVPEPGGVRLEFEANGFLYKMVRNITGTLLEIAQGKRPIEDIHQLLLAKNRRKAGMAAPPHGLFLFKVNYRDLK